MDVTSRVLGLAYRRPRVLLVEAPGGRVLRMRAQDELAARGWGLAAGPASADLLAVGGSPGPQLQDRVDALWDQLPGPRSRSYCSSVESLGADLTSGRDQLLNLGWQRADVARRGVGSEADDGSNDSDSAEADGDHGGMDHGGMDLPGGLTMSGSGQDRDGLQLEQSQLELGPVLPGWPAGVLALLSLQGDVAVDVELRLLDDRPVDSIDGDVDRLDRAQALLGLAGSRHAAAARRARASAMDGRPASTAALARTVARDRVLRWSLRGLTTVTGDDLWSELLALLDDSASSDPVSLTAAGEALTGRELAALRLALAAAPALVPDRQPARA